MSAAQQRRSRRTRAIAVGAIALAIAMVGHETQSLAQPARVAAPKLTRPPKLVTFVEASYPPEERVAGKAAAVVLQIAITASGTVADATVMQSAGAAFDAAAIAAAKQFVFEPALVDDKPAAIKILYRYEFVLKAETPTTAELTGVIRGRKSHRALGKVTIELDSGERTTTDAAGRFRFTGVAPGKRTLALSGDTFASLRTEEEVEAGKHVDVAYDVEEKEANALPAGDSDDIEILIVAPPLKKQVISTEVSADQGRKVPGTQGDVLKVVENLPGVARSAAGSGQLVIWGAAPEDTHVYVDGVHVPRLYHDGGFRSVIHSDLVQSVALTPGAYGASYGRGLGGLVTVELRPLVESGFHGSVAADFLDASAALRASVGDTVHVAIAFRKSYLDGLVPLVTSKDTSTLFPIPRYYDGQARIAFQVSKRASVEIGAMLSSDQTDRVANVGDPALEKSESTELRWTRFYAKYREETDSGVVTLTPWVGTESSSLTSRFGATPTQLSIDGFVAGLRASYRTRAVDGASVTIGVDAEASSQSLSRSGSVTSPPREGDVRVFGQAPSDQVSADDWSVVTAAAAPFVEGDIALGDHVHLVPGLRLDPYVVSGSRRTPVVGDTPSIGFFTSEALLEPRVALVADVSPRVRAKLAYGRFHATPSAQDLSAVFGNPSLDAALADHFVASALFHLTDTLTVEATSFYTRSTDLAARSASPAPLLAEALVQSGSGRSFGTQILLRKELASGLFGWVSYTLSRAERQDTEDGSWRLFDYDQTHVFTALASYVLPGGFEFGARFRYATGFPRTPISGAYFDARTDTYEPIFGAHNSTRIAPFMALDLRLTKRFAIGKTELEAYLDVQNVTNRKNPEEIVYTHDYSHPGNINGFPILPSLGLRYAW